MRMALLLDALPEGYVFSLEQQTFVQIVIHLINLIILAFVLGKLLYKPVLGFMHDRAQKLGRKVKRAEDDMAKANALSDE
jgi:F0F1-type ATP synthase membrane subunit b/b'